MAGTQQELESLEAMPPEARVGIWMFEWYWKQPGNTPDLDQFVADMRKRSDGKVPTARTWFGYVTIHAYALACEKAKTIEAKAVAKALADLEMPPEIKLQPNKVYYRERRSSAHDVGLHRRSCMHKGDGDPEDLFKVDHVVAGDKTSPHPYRRPAARCRWPA